LFKNSFEVYLSEIGFKKLHKTNKDRFEKIRKIMLLLAIYVLKY